MFRRSRRGNGADAGRRRRILIAVSLIALASSSAAQGRDDQGDPALDYLLQCQGCHGADALGAEDVGVPRMAGFVGRFLAVPGGRAYLVQVPGVSQAPLSNAALAALLNWTLQRFSEDELPDSFEPYSGDEVAGYRRAAPVDVVALRARLMAALAATEPTRGSVEE